MTMMTRRALLRAGLGAGAALLLATPRAAAQMPGRGMPGGPPAGLPLASPPVVPFQAPLPIPPVLAPTARNEAADYYEITQRATQVEILPGLPTTIWGYDGLPLGPTIVARRDRPVVVRQVNALPVPTVVHLHGGHVPAESDGHPLDTIAPGDAREYRYPNAQSAATLWYHDHAMGATGRNVYHGLAGFYLLTDDEEAALPLPAGAYDVPLAIQDRLFAADGALAYPVARPTVMHGMVGDTILVNGAVQPFFRVAARRYRFRLLNGSNARSYALALSSGAPFIQIGADGGLLPAPVARPVIRLAPGERADVVIDFGGLPVGSQVVLQNWLGGSRTGAILRFDVAWAEADDSAVPAVLRPLAPPDPAGAVASRDIVLGFDMWRGLWTLNGRPFDPDRVDAAPRLGTAEIWRFVNAGGMGMGRGRPGMGMGMMAMAHPMHLHHGQFRVLDRDGGPPEPGEAGWKDTVRVDPGGAVRVLVRFDDYAGRYVHHCHLLEHEDYAMMGQFRVEGD